jgi:hypothetical protein
LLIIEISKEKSALQRITAEMNFTKIGSDLKNKN